MAVSALVRSDGRIHVFHESAMITAPDQRGIPDGNGCLRITSRPLAGALIAAGRFWLPVEQTFPLARIADAHRVSEHGHVRGRLVLVVSGTVG